MLRCLPSLLAFGMQVGIHLAKMPENLSSRALNPSGGRKAGKPGCKGWPVNTTELLRALAQTGCAGQVGTQLIPCLFLQPAWHPCTAVPGAGRGRWLSPAPDGAVTLGSSGRSPRPTDPVRHLPLPRGCPGSAVPSPGQGRAQAAAGPGISAGHGCPERDPAFLRLSGNLFC